MPDSRQPYDPDAPAEQPAGPPTNPAPRAEPEPYGAPRPGDGPAQQSRRPLPPEYFPPGDEPRPAPTPAAGPTPQPAYAGQRPEGTPPAYDPQACEPPRPAPTPAECPPRGPATPDPAPDPEGRAPVLRRPGPFQPPRGCGCPPDSGQGASPTKCLEDLIERQAKKEAEGAAATSSKKVLEARLASARTAGQKYTQAKYDELVRRWTDQDAAIAALAAAVACDIGCWQCVLECHVGPLLHEIARVESDLYDDGRIPRDVHTLYDVRHWHCRNVARLRHRLDRITAVLDAWTLASPADTLEKALNDNKALYDKLCQIRCNEHGKVLYDLFLKLIPKHLAIAPTCRTVVTKIPRRFTEFSFGGGGRPDRSCGPDVGRRSLLKRLSEPPVLPNLVEPSQYLTVVCCLIEDHYAGAQQAWSEAKSDLDAADRQIAAHEARLKDWVKEVNEEAYRTIPAAVDCNRYCPAAPAQDSNDAN